MNYNFILIGWILMKLVLSHLEGGRAPVWGLGCQSVCDGCTCCTWWNWDIWDRPSTLGLTRPPQDKIWLSSEHGCLVTEINDFSHAVSSPSSCLSSPFPELSIITVGVYFTFLHSGLLPILWWRESRDQSRDQSRNQRGTPEDSDLS